MRVEQYVLGSPGWLWPAITVFAILLVASLFSYTKAGWNSWRAAAFILKGLGLAALAICLVEPMGRGTRPRPQANVVPIMVDTSQSMRVRNADAAASTADRLLATIAEDSVWQTRLEQMFDVRRYLFDDRLDGRESFQDLRFEGAQSNLRTSLETLATRFANRPVAGTLLLTDGNWTDAADGIDWQALGFPIYPITDGVSAELRDMGIGKIAISETNFETAPVTVEAVLTTANMAGESATVELRTPEGKVLQKQSIEITDAATEYPIRFRFRPEKSGVNFFQLHARLSSELASEKSQPSGTEATLLNNDKLIAVNQRRGPFGVLYVSGRPNWEFKYLRRSLDEDAELRLVGLVRIAKRQPKFSFRDSSVQSSANPLFAGLGGDEEETAEQLDEAVVIRLGVEDFSELAGGFPDNAGDLFPFSAVILDDIEADFFTQDQLLLIRQFVSVRGGALLMLGGDDALEKGAYDQTPLGELAPVYLSNNIGNVPTDWDGPSGPFQMKLTREGMLQPFLRLRGTEQAEGERLSQSPPLRVLNQIERIKPGAVVYAEAIDAQGQSAPALVSQPFGRGKAATMLIGDLWRWALQREAESESIATAVGSNRDDPAQMWRQVVRWMVSDVQRQVEARVEPAETPGLVRIVTEVRDREYALVDGAEVKLTLETPDGQAIDLVAEPKVEVAGTYQADFWPRDPGGYRATVVATGEDGISVGRCEIGWAADPAAAEFDQIGNNMSLLQQIADSTGGRVLTLNQIDDVVSELEARPVPVEEVWVYPVWHRWWVCLFAIACLCGEWGIRRWKGLA